MKTNGPATVATAMSGPAISCQPDTDLAAVAKMMWDHDCGFVPVVGPSGAVVGVITDRDICIAASTRGLRPEHIAAAQAMTGLVHGCLPTDAVSDALATMKQFRVRRLVVIDTHGHLQGVLSMNDIVRLAESRGTPSSKEVVSVLAAICAHRHVAGAVV